MALLKSGFFRRLLVLCLAFSLVWIPAKAEYCFVIDVDRLDMNSLRDSAYVEQNLSAQTSGIRVQKYISDSNELAARVRLTILQGDTNTLIFDKNYGYQSGTFDSGDIYLPSTDSRTVPYLITLYIEDWVYAMPFMHLMPRLSYNGACTYGVRMIDYNPSLTSDWLMGTMLDLNALRAQGWVTLPLCASNAFIVGEATVSVSGNELSVSLAFYPQANVELHRYAVYCIGNPAELTSVDPSYMPQRAYGADERIDITGMNTMLLYLPMSISYDSAGLSGFSYDLWNDAGLQQQLAMWNESILQGYQMPSEEPYAPGAHDMPGYQEPPQEEFPPYEEPFPTVIPEMPEDPYADPYVEPIDGSISGPVGEPVY
jgi:hypothetical protein